MTLGDLLDMRSGLEYRQYPLDDDCTTLVRMYLSPDWARFTLNQPMASRPGERFNYSEGDANVVSAILSKATGSSTLDFAERELFGPLGISNLYWQHDPSGNTAGDDGLYLRPRDLAKIGYLYLMDGVWKGRRILPPGWSRGILAGSVEPNIRGA
jgi:CubicO group peptidase (beta-lactamase class C family)